MKAAGIILMLCVAAMVVYFPVAYLNHHATFNKDLADANRKLEETQRSLLAAQQELRTKERQTADWQRDRGTIEDLRNSVTRLTAELQSAKQELSRHQTQLAEARNRVIHPPQPLAVPVSEELAVCPYCGGDFEHQWVTCERSARGSGCDGKGYRECFACLGAGTNRCTKCGGGGQVEVVTRSGGTFQTPRTHTERCTLCGGRGHTPCRKCDTLYVRQPFHRFLDPIISQGKPLAKTEFLYCGYHVLVAQNYADWIQVRGCVICPKCDGRGKIKVKGPCPHCKEGKIPISELPVELRP